VSRKNRRKRSIGSGSRTFLTTVFALGVFGLLGTLPLTLKALNLHIQPVAATSGYGVRLLPAPKNPSPVALPAVATPIDPHQPAASLPAVDSAREAALVSAEDSRIRILLHASVRVYQPEVLPVRASLPTLILTAGSRPYTASDLANYGALVFLPHHAALLIDNVFVATHAQLDLGSSRVQALYLDSSTGGFASIIAWGGDLLFQGTPTQPLTIMGWDRVAKTPAKDQGYGRSYIRDVGGKMNFSNVRVSSLGFWSGRTGGVAWTGVNGQPSTGGADNTTFTNDTYGAFVSRGMNIKFSSDLFEFNALDGLHIHRYSIGTSVTFSSAARNGGTGFLIDRATQNTYLRDDVSENNEGNGFFVDGRPLVNGASASGSAVAPGSGATIARSEALDNDRTGILVEGGTGTVLLGNQVCAQITGIAVRYNATNAVVTGNDVRCDPRSGLSIGPGAPGAIISGNTVSGARVAVLVRSSGRIEIDNSLITGATVFGITARGVTSQVRGVGNVISGTGFRSVDARADASQPALSGTNTTGWLHHVKITFWSYLLFHPLAALWLSILVLVILCYLWSRRRRLPPHPYPASTRWRPVTETAAALSEPGPRYAQPEFTLAGAVASRNGHAAKDRLPRTPAEQPEIKLPVMDISQVAAAALRDPGTSPDISLAAAAALRGPATSADLPAPAAAPREPMTSADIPLAAAAPREPADSAGTGPEVAERDWIRAPSPAGSVWHRAPSGPSDATAPRSVWEPVPRSAPARHRAPVPDSREPTVAGFPGRPTSPHRQVPPVPGAQEPEPFAADVALGTADDATDATRPLPQVVD